ncbi:hypothetical protein FRC14_000275 [Serendipita sp. 396]|nr:hypothetical protein FRC14_000275 [Serendipita sp. 396]KAG8786203.1 hypothetical protein FRC15_011903 [Serendipita sp. 397]KAG8828543.1 hypothetical protein FRC19_003882 [Serendipita sp. 401]KAG8870181.1 hypothetical protein FRC20_000288 [Serendipita sp. 405]KAG9058587.1 hypothetical protein FS842_008009 [Serendipita sp. 407]
MAYQPEYQHQHPYANYSTPTYHHPSAAPASPHPHPMPMSPSIPSNSERISIPPSPSSFIYNRNIVPYEPRYGGQATEGGNHSTYHHPAYHPQNEGSAPVLYRQHSIEDRRHSHPHHTYIQPNPPPPPPPTSGSSLHEYHHDQRASSSVHPHPPTPPQHQHHPSVHQIHRSQEPEHPPPPAGQSQYAQEMYAAADVQNGLSEADDRLMRYHFPHDSQAHLRRALFHVLNAPWKLANEREPTDEVLLQFTVRSGKLYQCAFYKAEGRCVKEFDRKDRVLDHIRTHIDLQPFVCRELGCCQRFCSKPDLLQHEKNKEKTQCDQCGAKILPKNLARHKATALCRAGRWTRNEGSVPIADSHRSQQTYETM